MARFIAAGGRLTSERRFYLGFVLALLAIVVVGFGPSFYLRGVMTSPRPNPTLTPGVLLHSVGFTLWLVVLAAQVGFVAAGRRDLHRTLGVGGFGLAAALVPTMYLTSVWQVARGTQPPMIAPLDWTVVPLLLMLGIVVLLVFGWRTRRTDLQAHKRLMLGVAIMLTEPAIGRLPIVPPSVVGFTLLNLLSWLPFVALMLWDRRTLRRLHWATRLGAALFAVVLVARIAFLAVPGSWAGFAAHLPGVG